MFVIPLIFWETSVLEKSSTHPEVSQLKSMSQSVTWLALWKTHKTWVFWLLSDTCQFWNLGQVSCPILRMRKLKWLLHYWVVWGTTNKNCLQNRQHYKSHSVTLLLLFPTYSSLLRSSPSQRPHATFNSKTLTRWHQKLVLIQIQHPRVDQLVHESLQPQHSFVIHNKLSKHLL